MSETKKVVGIVQARMASTRLPGKVVAEVVGRPLLAYMLERLGRCDALDEVVVATPGSLDNRPIWDVCLDFWPAYRGPGDENDVLSRVLAAARSREADVIVELTADCPLIDPKIVGRAVELYLACPRGLVTTTRDCVGDKGAYPRGMDVRVFSTDYLARIDALGDLDEADREHVSLRMWENPLENPIQHLMASPGLASNLRLTVDTPEDLALVRAVFEHFVPRSDFSLDEVLTFLSTRPNLIALNACVEQKTVR